MTEKIIIGGGEDLGVEYDENEYVFPFFGKEIRVHPLAGELSYLKFMEAASKIDEDNESEGLPLVMGFLRQQIHPDDFDEFYDIATRKRQKMQDLMNVSNKVLEAMTDFPTGQPSDSQPTPQKTGPRSKAASSRAGTSRARRTGAAKSAAALTLLKGRPDLQQAVALAQEAQSVG